MCGELDENTQVLPMRQRKGEELETQLPMMLAGSDVFLLNLLKRPGAFSDSDCFVQSKQNHNRIIADRIYLGLCS